MEATGPSLVLEIFKMQDALKMSAYEQKDISPTLRHYSQVAVPFDKIQAICLGAISILNRADKRTAPGSELLPALKKTGQLLWDQLLTRPVKDKLKAASLSHLTLSIDEELINIPWEFLYDGNEFLCLKFNLGRLIRAAGHTSPPQYRSLSSSLKMLVLANPTDDLKSAYLEGLQIKNQFDKKRDEIRIDFKSTNIDTLYVKNNLRDYDIVHFAGHCEYDPADPQKSGWVLSDGRFSAQDIYALGETLSLPALIFSNACLSAAGNLGNVDIDCQEHTYSLASAFLFSGVRHYIGAIRKIEDTVSLDFARDFYSHMIKGESVGESLRLARLGCLKSQGHLGFSWSSYLLYGDPNFILLKRRTRQSKTRRINLVKYRKPASLGALISGAIILSVFLFSRLPTINPNTYMLYSKSQRLFLSGKNFEVISLASQIIQKDPMFLAAYPLMGDTYYRLGDRDNALKYYFEYARFCEKKHDLKNLASAYTGIGWIYHLQGDYTKAFDFYNRAITLSRDNIDRLHEARVLERLAVWYIDQQDNDKALELLMKSSQINRDRQYIREHLYGLACDYFDIAIVYTNKGDLGTAKEFYGKSRRLFEKLKLKHELSDYYFNLGEIYLFQKEYQKALDCYLKGLAIDEEHGHKPNLASDYNMIGELHKEMDNLDEAQRYFNQALSLCRQIDAPIELGNTYYNLGLVSKQRGFKNQAREYFRKAQEIFWVKDRPRYDEIKKEILGLSNAS